jgi:hypothetical protein
LTQRKERQRAGQRRRARPLSSPDNVESGRALLDLYIDHSATLHLYHRVTNHLALQILGVARATGAANPHISMATKIREEAVRLGFDERGFSKALSDHIKRETAEARKPFESPERLDSTSGAEYFSRERSSLESLIHSRLVQLEAEMGRVPNSVEKARTALCAQAITYDATMDSDQTLDAIVLLKDELAPDIPRGVIEYWREADRFHRNRRGDRVPDSPIFWISREDLDELDGVSRYRFRDAFNVGEVQPAFDAVEGMLATSLVEGTGGLEGMMSDMFGDARIGKVAYTLWSVSRCRTLANRIRLFVDAALLRIARQRAPDGWWTDLRRTEKGGRLLPNPFLTSLCTLAFLKLGTTDKHAEIGRQSARWLLENQLPGGGWPFEPAPRARLGKADVLTTTLCVEALVRSRVPNLQHAIDTAVQWIASQQDGMGLWEDRGTPFPLLTVVVLELFELLRTWTIQPSDYLRTTQRFIHRAQRLVEEGGAGDRQLAVVAAYHSIESFLYGLLSDPRINHRIFNNDGTTIGARKAITSFQTYLQDGGSLGRNALLPYRNSLDRLASLRDQVVHKGLSVGEDDCRELVADAQRFISHYSVAILGGDILS